ncbi:MAG: protein translocase subunit SecF [Syntrophomonadaceae bacterium]
MRLIEKRNIFYIISLILVAVSLVSLVTRGLNTGIDFKGGTVLQMNLGATATPANVRELLNGISMDKAEVQQSGDQYIIRTPELTQEQSGVLIETLKAQYPGAEYLGADTVGAVIGKELVKNAIWAVLLGCLAMLVYISFRFEWKFGVAAIAAEFHDVIIVLGLFSIFQWEINSAFIAGILTVVGYSINDTIVIFDRIRENLKSRRKEDFAPLVNRSVLQSLNRSINTVLTCVFALVALIVFGGVTIKYFVLAMLVGFVFGAYSSIFVASPIWYDLNKRF